MPRIVVSLGCLSLVCLFLAGYSALFAIAFLVLGAGAACVYFAWRRKSRYDLGLLREIHETGGPPPEDDLPEIEDDAGVYCTGCGETYAAWLLACPRCKCR